MKMVWLREFWLSFFVATPALIIVIECEVSGFVGYLIGITAMFVVEIASKIFNTEHRS